MKEKNYTYLMAGLSLAGVLFSGYLSAVKLLSDTCAFNETCPYFLGYPSCFYGFGMFFGLFVVSLLALTNITTLKRMTTLFIMISGIGVIFSGYFAIPEITRLFSETTSYGLGLPSCVYGFAFFIIIFGISFHHLRKR
ncbi:vitamin K epoxide reductase family protein [candidate division KSB1 bacterium]